MSLHSLIKIILPLLLLANQTAQSKAYIPESDGVIVFTQLTPTPDKNQALTLNSAIKSATIMLNEAALVGNDNNHDQAKRLLSTYLETHNNTELFYLWAKVLQHEHHFDEALTWLNKVFKIDQKHVPARLMAARIALIQNNAELAKSHCTQLLTVADMLTSSICLFEAQSYIKDNNNLAKSYQELIALTENHPIPESHKSWLAMILADMAERMSKPIESRFWLDQYPDFNNSSYLIAWADIYLKTNHNQIVLDKLTDIYNKNKQNNKVISDGMLLRLALAEKKLNQQNKNHTKLWFTEITERVQLRELRQDKTHANELTQYYLFLSHDPKKALYWAEINWTHAKEFKDETLLKAAKLANKADNT